jgi:hypothetical protein
MPLVAEARFQGDMVVATLEEGVAMVVMVVVTSPTRRGTNFLPVSCTTRLIIWCSSVIRDLIQISWEKKEALMMHTHTM